MPTESHFPTVHRDGKQDSGQKWRRKRLLPSAQALEPLYLDKQHVVRAFIPPEVCLPLRPVIVVVLSPLLFFKP